jgi:hypothetical protein
LASKTLDDFFPVVAFKEGPSYVDARDAILAAAAQQPDEVRGRLEAILAASPEWQSRMAAEVLLGWLDHREAFTLCAIYARGDLVGREPVAGFKPQHRGRAIAGLGTAVTPRILELLMKTGECTDREATEALFHALTLLEDPRAAEPMLALASRKGERDLRAGALRVLSALADSRGIEPSLKIVQDPWEPAETRSAAVYALVGFQGDEIGPALLGFLERPDFPSELRQAAAEALYRRADPATRPGLLAALPRVEDETVLPTLLLAVGEVGTEADVPVLQAYAGTGNEEVQQLVRKAIARILRRKEASGLEMPEDEP